MRHILHPIILFGLFVLGSVPLSAVAAINVDVITPYSEGIVRIINGVIVPVLLAIAFLFFLWGLYKYFIWNNDSESEKMEGRKFAMWGIIGFVIIFSIWSLVGIVRGTLGFTGSVNTAPAPTFNRLGG